MPASSLAINGERATAVCVPGLGLTFDEAGDPAIAIRGTSDPAINNSNSSAKNRRADRCRAYADELLAISLGNGLRELEASARRWRGAACLAEMNVAPARSELTLAATMAAEIGRLRLRLDTESALATLCAKLGQGDAARRHDHSARNVIQAMENSLVSSGLEARLHV